MVWQLESENPYQRDPVLDLPERLVVKEVRSDLDQLFSQHPATRGISELCFQYTGYVNKNPKSTLDFEFLVKTGRAGRVPQFDFWQANAQFGLYNPRAESVMKNRRGSANKPYFLGVHVTGANAEKSLTKEMAAKKSNTNVIYMCDVDLLADYFVDIRNNPIQRGISYEFQNMAFVLNLIDSMVGEETFLELRSRKIRHMTLRVVEETTEQAMQEVYDATQQLEQERLQAESEVKNAINEEIGPLKQEIARMEKLRAENKPVDILALTTKKRLAENIQLQQQQKLTQKQEELANSTRENLRSIQLDAEKKIQEIQKKFKLSAVFIPPIPPLLVGLIVFTRRRLREREGISKARRLK